MKKKHPKRFIPDRYQPSPHIGVDEVGRGCLAGPVVAAAVILTSSKHNRYLGDSKQLTLEERRKASSLLHQHHKVSIGWCSPQEIDQINIHFASLLAMKRAVEGLGVTEGHVVVDGRFTIPDLPQFPQTALVKGDTFAPPISAASIVAKVFRDDWMVKYAEEFPGYGFEKHKGYATEIHRQAILAKGYTKIHRRSFVLSEAAGFFDENGEFIDNPDSAYAIVAQDSSTGLEL